MEIIFNKLARINNQTYQDPSNDIIDKAKAELISLLEKIVGGVDPEQLHYNGHEFVIWPDTSLGCPKAGHAYAQVQMPGYKIQFQYQERMYSVHTDLDGSRFVTPDITPTVAQPIQMPSIFDMSTRAV